MQLRIRSIHHNAFISASLARVSDGAERCYWRLQCLCDDAGRAEDDVDLIKGMAFPKFRDLTIETIEAWMTELHEEGLINRYEGTDGNPYFEIVKWHRYQHPRRPTASKIPPPASGWEMTGPDGPRPVATKPDNDGPPERQSDGVTYTDTTNRPDASRQDRTDPDTSRREHAGEGAGEGGGEGAAAGATPDTEASAIGPAAAALIDQAVEIILVARGKHTAAASKANPSGWLHRTRIGIHEELVAAGAATTAAQPDATVADLIALLKPSPSAVAAHTSPPRREPDIVTLDLGLDRMDDATAEVGRAAVQRIRASRFRRGA